MKKVLFISSTGGHLSEMMMLNEMFKKYDDLEIQAPFIMMSTRPGIGYKYLTDHVQELINNL